VPEAMRFEVGLFFKKRPAERCEMFGTRPRRIASSAISRWLQWLMGRSLASGFSHVIATIAQICSGVYNAGAPGRDASTSRSGTDTPSAAIRHRLRQRRTVFGHTSSSSALLAYTYPVRRKQHDVGPKGQLLWRRMGSYQMFQHFALFGRNRHRRGGQ
jgi:hypothetical protein